MANNQDEMVKLTLYFDYQNNEAGYKKIMSSIDKLSVQANAAIKNNASAFANPAEMQKSIAAYQENLSKVRRAVMSAYNADTGKFNIQDAINFDQSAFDNLRDGIGGVRTEMVQLDQNFTTSAAVLNKYREHVDHFKESITNAFRYNVINKFLDVLMQQISGSIQYIRELDTALNGIRIVTGNSSEDMLKFAENIQEAAHALGRTATEYAEASLLFYQMGYDEEEVLTRTEDTLILANITGTSLSEAASQLTAVLNGFQLAGADSTRVLDVMAKLGADTATDFAEIATAMQKVASQANSANISLEETAAMLAVIMSITREAPETAGTSLKAIIARLNELKFASGEETSRVQKQFANIGMSIFDANGQLKDTMVLFQEIAEAFKTADTNTKKVIATAVAGAEQQNRFLALMENWDTYNEYLDKAYNSSGTALEQNEIYMESFEAHVKKVKSTIDSIKFDFFMDKDFTVVLDTVDGILQYVRVLLDDFGGLNEILAIGGALMLKMFGGEIITNVMSLVKETKTLYSNVTHLNAEGGKAGFFTRIKEFFAMSTQWTANKNSDLFKNAISGAATFEQKMQAVNLVSRAFGETTGEQFKNQTERFQTLTRQLNNYKIQLQSIVGLQNDAKIYTAGHGNQQNSLTSIMNQIGLAGNQEVQNRINNYFHKTLGMNSMLPGKMPSLQAVFDGLNSYFKQAPADLEATSQQYQRLNTNMERAGTEAQQLTARFESMKVSLDEINKRQVYINLVSSAIIALPGALNAVGQAMDGDPLGAVAGGLSSVGMALMMIPGPAQAVGLGMTAVGSIVSFFNSRLEKEQQELEETRKKNLELAETYKTQEESLNKLNKTYQKAGVLNSSNEELNSTVEQLEAILGEGSLVAYYDEAGNAVYKTKEEVDALTQAYLEQQKVLAQNAALETWKAANTELQEYRSTYNTLTKNETKSTNSFDRKNELSKILPLFDRNDYTTGIAGTSDRYLNKEGKAQLQKLVDEGEISQEIAEEFEGSTKNTLSRELTEAADDLATANKTIEESLKDFNDETLPTIKESMFAQVTAYGYEASDNAKLMASTLTNAAIEQMSKGLLDPDIAQNWNQIIQNLYSEFTDSDKIKKILQGDKDAADEFKQFLQKQLGEGVDITPFYEGIIGRMKDAEEENEKYSKSVAGLADSVEGLEKTLGTAGDAFEEFRDEGKLSLDTINALDSTFGSLPGFQSLMNEYAQGTLTLNGFKEGLSSLVGAWFEQQVAVDGITEANVGYYETLLKSMGITNAHEVAQHALAKAQGEAAISTSELGETFEKTIGDTELSALATQYAKQSYYELKKAEIAANEQELSFDQQIEAIRALGNNISDTTGDVIASTAALQAMENMRAGMSYDEAWTDAVNRAQEQLGSIIDNLASVSIDITGAIDSNGSKTDAYTAEIDKYKKYTDEIARIQEKIKDLDYDINATEDYTKKNEYISQQIVLLEEQQKLQHEMNEERDKEIAQNVELLRQKGFLIDYDPYTNELEIKNREHLNELKAKDTKATNELIKETEKLIKNTESLNKANQESSKTWRENVQTINDSKKEMEQNRRDMVEKNINDNMFNTVFFEDLQSGTQQIKRIYEQALEEWQRELEIAYSQGLDNTDSYVQSVIKNVIELRNKIREIDKQIFDETISNLNAVKDLLAKATKDTWPQQLKLVEKEIELTEQRIAEKIHDGSENALQELLELYGQQAALLKEQYDLQKQIYEDQKDDYDAVIDAVSDAIDEEIDRIKEEKEALKEANDEREREIELMKLKAALEAAQNQKTIQIYRKNQGFVWEADRDAINDAQKALDDFYADDKEKELDARIDALEKYKEEWEKIPDTITKSENAAKAAEILGKDWQEKIFDLRKDILDDFGDTYEDTLKGIKNLEEDYNKQIKKLAEDMQDVVDQIEQSKKDINDILNGDNEDSNSKRKAYRADKSGNAPSGLKTGDVVQTTEGLYQVSTEEKEGYNYNENTHYWSKKINDSIVSAFEDLDGSEIVDQETLQEINDLLEEQIPKTIDDNTSKVNTNTQGLEDNTKTVAAMNKNLGSYTKSISSAVLSADSSSKVAKDYAREAEQNAENAMDSAIESEYWADKAEEWAKKVKDKDDDPNDDTGQYHTGINAGPVGSYAGQQAFQRDFLRIANEGIRDNEMWALLQKGEAVFTPEQLNNMLSSLNLSLDTIDQLSSMQKGIFTAGQLSSLDIRAKMGNKGENVTAFGDININMYGVNDVDTFSTVLKNNVTSIFAQAIAGR